MNGLYHVSNLLPFLLSFRNILEIYTNITRDEDPMMAVRLREAFHGVQPKQSILMKTTTFTTMMCSLQRLLMAKPG